MQIGSNCAWQLATPSVGTSLTGAQSTPLLELTNQLACLPTATHVCCTQSSATTLSVPIGTRCQLPPADSCVVRRASISGESRVTQVFGAPQETAPVSNAATSSRSATGVEIAPVGSV